MTLDWLDLTLAGLTAERQAQLTRLAKWCAIFLLLVVTILTLIPDPLGDDMDSLPFDDKTGHFLAYLSLMSSWAYAVVSPVARIKAFAALAAYGGALEGFQAAMGYGRQASWADMAANSLGLIVGLALAIIAARSFRVLHNRFLAKS